MPRKLKHRKLLPQYPILKLGEKKTPEHYAKINTYKIAKEKINEKNN